MQRTRTGRLLLSLAIFTFLASSAAAQPDDLPKPAAKQNSGPAWRSLFNGKTLESWAPTKFGGEAEVRVEDGRIILPAGTDMTGVTWNGLALPRNDYEIELEAMRIDGYDFFCGLTFPFGKEHCSLILGGWGGVAVGLSTIDRADASQNETTQSINFKEKRWYRVRVRVTETRIQAWLDGNRIIDVDSTGKKIDVRVEMLLCKPLGVATWQTTGALRNIKLRELTEVEIAEAKKK